MLCVNRSADGSTTRAKMVSVDEHRQSHIPDTVLGAHSWVNGNITHTHPHPHPHTHTPLHTHLRTHTHTHTHTHTYTHTYAHTHTHTHTHGLYSRGREGRGLGGEHKGLSISSYH